MYISTAAANQFGSPDYITLPVQRSSPNVIIAYSFVENRRRVLALFQAFCFWRNTKF